MSVPYITATCCSLATFFGELTGEVRLHGVIAAAVVVLPQNHHVAIICQLVREVCRVGPNWSYRCRFRKSFKAGLNSGFMLIVANSEPFLALFLTVKAWMKCANLIDRYRWTQKTGAQTAQANLPDTGSTGSHCPLWSGMTWE